MKKLIENIFSVKNENVHKVFTCLGIKVKIKNKNKILLYKLDALNKNLNNNYKNIVKDITKINTKCKKDFIIDNVENPKFFNVQQDIYYFYQEMMSRKFFDLFKFRLSNTTIIKALEKCQQKINSKNIAILTDIKNFPKNFNIIDVNKIYTLKDSNTVVVLCYNNDFEAIKISDLLKSNNIPYMSLPVAYPLARYFHTDKNALEVLSEEAKNKNWHFCPGDFENIFQAIKNAKNLDGVFIEIGTFRGDSGSALLNYMKKSQIIKSAYFLDTFEGFNYDEAYTSEDIYWQGTHTDTSLDNVVKRFKEYDNAKVIKSNIITDELPSEIEKICVANIDVDMYEAVKATLYKVKDKIVTNGIIICEDYGHTPALLGGQKAVREFLSENPDMFTELYLTSGQMFLIKKV